MNIKDCADFVRNFLNYNCPDTTLLNQLEWLKTYNFAQLGLVEGVHEDSTKLAKAIYFKIWHNKLPLVCRVRCFAP